MKDFAHIAKLLISLTHHDAKFAWISSHLISFNTPKSTLLEAPILHYPDPSNHYIVYTDASDDACGAQLSQEHDSQELPVAFLSHTFKDSQWKWSTMEQKAYCIYYTVIKWNYYLQGSDIVVHNEHRLLQKFLNGIKCQQQGGMHGLWNLPLTTSHLSEYQLPATKQLTASHDW